MTSMPAGDAERTIADYASALASHLADVERYLALTDQEAQAAASGDVTVLESLVAARDAEMARLLDTAAALAPVRQVVESLGPPWNSHPAWVAAATTRARIRERLDTIAAQDAQTLAVLEASRNRSQQDLQELEAASATLVAYRRTLAPATRPAALLDHRG